jgi:hypothetical protein
LSQEISIRTSINLRSTTQPNNNYRTVPGAYIADYNGVAGPVPGSFLVPVTGIDVDFSKLTVLGGFIEIWNIDAANPVHYGIYDPDTNEFYPLFQLKAGEGGVPGRLSTQFGGEYQTGTGTGTSGSGARLRFFAPDGAAWVRVMAFDA